MRIGEPQPKVPPISQEPQNTFSPEELIRKYNLRVIWPSKRLEIKIPEEVDLTALQGVGIGEERAKLMLELIVKYINLPIILDQFGQDHEARRKWLHEVKEKYGMKARLFLDANKLSLTEFSLPFDYSGFMTDLKAYMKKVGDKPVTKLFTKIRDILIRFRLTIKGYREMDIDGKMESVKKVESIFLEVLELFKKKEH